jgi:Peptidase inhibitor family I36
MEPHSRALTIGATAVAMASVAAVAVVAPAPGADAHNGPHVLADCPDGFFCAWDGLDTFNAPYGSMVVLGDGVDFAYKVGWSHDALPGGHPYGLDNSIDFVFNRTNGWWALYDGYAATGPRLVCVAPGHVASLADLGHKNEAGSIANYGNFGSCPR